MNQLQKIIFQNRLLCCMKSSKNKMFHLERHKNDQYRASRLPIPFVKIGLSATLMTLVAYDGIVNEFIYFGASIRFLRSLKAASLIAVDYLLIEHKKGAEDYEVLLKAVHKRSADRLLQTCLLNGGLYIKVGQGVAAINHILPKEYTSTLEQLQNECLPTSRKDVQKCFHEEFGKLPEELFQEFDYNPVAAASLAQVFKGKLKSGEHIAVKVQYSDLKRRFRSDLGTIMFLQDVVQLFFKNYDFGWILRDLNKNLLEELNFAKEGKNAEKCADDLKKLTFVYVPKVYWNFTSMRVLTLEWIDGIKISNLDEIYKRKLNLKDIDIKLFEMFSEQIFNTGFVHADPHPGNIFVRKNNTSGKAELVLLDHGLYEVLPEHIRLPLCEFWEAVVLRDDTKMRNAANKLSITDHMKFAEVLFQQPIRINNGRIKTRLTEDDVAYMQELAKQNFDIIMSTLMEMPRNMLFVVRNLNTVRSISRQHGDVVDRPRVMARYAQRCIYAKYNTISGYMRWIYRRMLFEYCLLRNSFKISCINTYFKVLHILGRAPSSARTLLSDLMDQYNA